MPTPVAFLYRCKGCNSTAFEATAAELGEWIKCPRCEGAFRVEAESIPLYAEEPAAVAALRELFEQCAMPHRFWGEESNQKEADAAIEAGRAVLAAYDAGKGVAGG